MAMFREHVAYGAVLSMVVCVAVYSYALVTDPILLLLLFGVTVVGSFLPDVDSDSGMPFYLVYGAITLAATGIVFLYTLDSAYADDWRYLIGIPAASLVFFWVVVGALVKKCTHHRGIFHSMPALLIASVATFLVARHYGLNDTVSLVFAAAMGIGFLSHLALDELHSEITLDGIPFNQKESAGTALKWFSRKQGANMAAYLLLATLLYSAFQPLKALAFYNDSDIIELEDDAPPAPPDDGGGTGDSSGTGSGAGLGGVVESTTGASQAQGSSNSGDGQSGLSGGGGSAQSGSGSGNPTSDEDLFDSLVGAGAISGPGALSGSSLVADSAVGGGDGPIIVDGDSVRRYFRDRFDLRDLLVGWHAGADARLNSRGLGYVAASTALRDRNVDTVSFTADRFDITYRSRGYLFSIIPITFPVHVSVIPAAAEGRVAVRLPWYRFFVREFFTAQGLADDIGAVIDAEIAKNADPDADLKAALFTAVATYLRTKVGTLADTVAAE